MSVKTNEAPRTDEVRIYNRGEHCISRRDIDPDALKILYRLLQYNHKAFLVGGGVRDLLLNKRPKDFDISTDATPRKIKEIFRNCRIIGRRFKLAHIYFKGNKIIEVSTFRDASDPNNEEDYAESGANLTVRDNKFGTEETDARRRDITINGLFYDIASFSVIDYVGGMQDLQDGIIRVIGDPDVRFPEDPVRMMRVIRHAVRAGFSIEEKTWDSLLKHRELLCDVPPMRVYEEIKKDLLSGRSLEMLRLFNKGGLLELLLPGITQSSTDALSHRKSLAHALESIDSSIISGEVAPSVAVIFAAIFYFTAEMPADGELTGDSLLAMLNEYFSDLAVPRKEKERIAHILFEWNRLENTPLEKIKPQHYAKRSYLADLLVFVQVIFPQQEEIISLLQKARRMNPQGDGHAKRQRRAQQHNRKVARII